jgi:hypothetical protein
LFGVVVDMEIEVDSAGVDAGGGHGDAVLLAGVGELAP